MTDFDCARCHKPDAARLDALPMPGPMGQRVFEGVCADCWKDWLRQQTAVINHYGLNLRDPEARKFLTAQTEAFLFGT